MEHFSDFGPMREDSIMLRTFGAFLSVFWLLGLLVHLGGPIHVLGVAALVLFGIELLLANIAGNAQGSRAQRTLL
jgi:hypothetical protein